MSGLRTPDERLRLAAYMSRDGTDAATSNMLADIVIDVWDAHFGSGSLAPLSIRYGIAYEVQRRLGSRLLSGDE